MRNHQQCQRSSIVFQLSGTYNDNYTDGTGKNGTTKFTNTENMAPHISFKIWHLKYNTCTKKSQEVRWLGSLQPGVHIIATIAIAQK